MTDLHADTSLRTTLLRELEEELFGRADLDNTVSTPRAALPMHPGRQSEPMRSLLTNDGLRPECTGFGFNLVSGNYEFACLVMIDHEDFWSRFGGQIEANWEARGLQSYPTRRTESLIRLTQASEWNNEGLFTFLRGLSRLNSSS